MASSKVLLVAVVAVLLVLPHPTVAAGRILPSMSQGLQSFGRNLKTLGLLGALFGFLEGEGYTGESPFIDAHNQCRNGKLEGNLFSGLFVGLGWGFGGHNYAPYPALPTMQYHPHLADLAQGWADNLVKKGCVLEHNPHPYIASLPGASIGENLAIYKTSNPGDYPNPSKICGNWAAERQYYDIKTNTCHAPGGEDNTCDHYKQIVSRKTFYAGCGTSRGDRDQHGQYTWVVVCNYLNSCPSGKPY